MGRSKCRNNAKNERREYKIGMGTKEKMIDRLLSIPKDYTYFELKGLASKCKCTLSQKGNGSRCMLIAPSGAKYVFHKPHNYSYFKEYAVKDIISFLRKEGLI